VNLVRRARVHPGAGHADAEATSRAVAHQVASLLLGYPDESLLGQLDLLERAVDGLAAPVREPLARVLAYLRETSPRELGVHYVAVLDQKRSCAPYLTYYAHGDTRRRGMALVRFSQVYRDAGMVPPAHELPDHLAVVLEFTATVDPEVGMALLQEHRAGLELLVRGLAKAGSPYADVVTAVLATLPPPSAGDLEAAARTAAEGPPQELVGLSPYSLDPLAAAEVRR
jgi:nitrate reductase molybdenum cofactor assembly chaperone